MTKLVKDWLEFAQLDLHTIEKIIDDPTLTSIVAFHAQQCIEKSYKAIILKFTGEIPRVHSLISLNGTVRNFLKVDVDIEIIKILNEIYIDSRYPSEIGMSGVNIPSVQTAKLFYKEANQIYKSIVEKLTD